MLLSSLQLPLLERSLQLSKFHCHKDYDHPSELQPVALRLPGVRLPLVYYTPGIGNKVPRNVI